MTAGRTAYRLHAWLAPFDSYGTVTADGGVITDVTLGDVAPVGATVLANTALAPGFVDLQVNGVGAVDFATAASTDAVHAALRSMLRFGTTACLPTVVTAPLRAYDNILAALTDARDAPHTGAAMLGVHLEGPFLGGAPGAHPTDHIRDVDHAWLERLLARHRELVRMVTLAPEADPGLTAVRSLSDAGVLVALGHSSCSHDVAVAAADAGARAVTHLFNGMSGLAHRNPGLAAAALLDARLTPTLIADFVHVHPVAVRLAAATRDRIALVTDAVAPGAGESGGLRIHERDGAVYLRDGTLAGSILTMDQAVRNVVSLGIPSARAVAMASTWPCDLVGAGDRGRLAVGARADLVALDRDTLHVRAAWLGGTAAEGV